jgi:hypothetical protein
MDRPLWQSFSTGPVGSVSTRQSTSASRPNLLQDYFGPKKWLTERFDTRDLKAAKALLDKLGSY